MRSVPFALLFAAISANAVAAQDLGAGELVFKKCAPCHMVGEAARSRAAPTLNGIEGRPAGTVEGFKYSEANKASGIVWNEETFKEYIRNPQARVPGTKMPFPGLKDEQEINSLWAFLKQFAPDGHKL